MAQSEQTPGPVSSLGPARTLSFLLLQRTAKLLRAVRPVLQFLSLKLALRQRWWQYALIASVYISYRLWKRWRRLKWQKQRQPSPPQSPAPLSTAPSVAPSPMSLRVIVDDTRDQDISTLPVTEETKEEMALKFLAETPYVHALGEAAYRELLVKMKTVNVQKGEFLCRAGDPCLQGIAAGLYVVRRGRLGVFSELSKEPISVVARGQSLGEFGVIGHFTGNDKQSVSVKALQDSELFMLSRTNYLTFIRSHPADFINFLRTAVAAQWRVASFALQHFLRIPLSSRSAYQGDEALAFVRFVEEKPLPSPAQRSTLSVSTPPDIGTAASDASSLRHTSGRKHRVPPAASVTPSSSGPMDSDEDEDDDDSDDGGGGVAHSAVGPSGGGYGDTVPPLRHPPGSVSPATSMTGIALGALGRGTTIPASVTEHGTQRTLQDGEILFERGDTAVTLFIVELGSLVALGPNREIVARIGEGCVAGGISFFGGTDRGETLAAYQHTSVLQFSRNSFNQLLKDDPLSALSIAQCVGAQLSPVLLEFFQLGLDMTRFKASDIIFRQGQMADSLYLMISGRVRTLSSASGRGHGLEDSDDESVADADVKSEPLNDEQAEQVYGSTVLDDSGSTMAFEVGRGETLGEATLLAGGADADSERSFTAVCVRDSTAVKLSRASFLHIVKMYPEVMIRFTQLMARRLHALNSRMSEKRKATPNITTVALIPIGSQELSAEARAQLHHPRSLPRGDSHFRGSGSAKLHLGAIAVRLARVLRKAGPTLHLNSAALDQALGFGTSQQLDKFFFAEKASHFITEQEQAHQFVLLEGDMGTESTPWNRCCLHHADCVVLVALAHSDHAVYPHEAELVWNNDVPDHLRSEPLSTSAPAGKRASHSMHGSNMQDHMVRGQARFGRHRMLLIVHTDAHPAYAPTNTRFWLRGRRVHSFHHIRDRDDSTFARFARHLSGQTVAVVLGGGGARGLAHQGVLKALEEAQLPVDILAGTSQGALMSALYAQNLSVEGMRLPLKRFCSVFWLPRMIWHLIRNLPWVLSYFGGFGFTDAVVDALGGKHNRIEDLWIPYFCVTTNMTESELNIHQYGPLWRAVRASMSILAYLPPVVDHNNHIHIDGGYVNNLPVDIVCSHWNPALVIGVDVEDKDASVFKGSYNYGAAVSGLSILWHKYIRRKHIVYLRDIIAWLSCINHSRQLRMVKDELIDIYIRPPVERYALLDYNKAEELEQLGYITARAAIDRWILEQDTKRLTQEAPRGLVHSTTGSVRAVAHQFAYSGQQSAARRASAVSVANKAKPNVVTFFRNSPRQLVRNLSQSMLDRLITSPVNPLVRQDSEPVLRRHSLVDLSAVSTVSAQDRKRGRKRGLQRRV